MKVSDESMQSEEHKWFEVIMEAKRVGEWAKDADGGRSWEQEPSFGEHPQSWKRRQGASKGQEAGGDPREKTTEEMRGGIVRERRIQR